MDMALAPSIAATVRDQGRVVGQKHRTGVAFCGMHVLWSQLASAGIGPRRIDGSAESGSCFNKA